MLSAALAVTALLLALGGVATRLLHHQAEEVVNERLRIAELAASRLDAALAADLTLLRALGNDPDSPAAELSRDLSIFTYGVFRLDEAGRILWHLPDHPGGEGRDLVQTILGQPSMRAALTQDAQTWTELARTPEGTPVVGLLEPLRPGIGPGGNLLALIDLQTSGLDNFLVGMRPEGETTHVVLVTEDGWVLAGTDPLLPYTREEHPEFFRELITGGTREVGRAAIEGSREPPHLMAAAPLRSAPWAVSVGQAEWEAMAPVSRLRWLLALFGGAAVLLAAIYAWWDATSVIRPLVRLTGAAQQVAGGNLEEPVAVQRRDEIGALGEAFERMRLRLRRAREQTKTLAVYEERDRIAREMHDSIAQSLGYMYSQLRRLQNRHAKEDHPELWAEFDDLARVASASYDEVRWAIFGLRTGRPHRAGLLSALAGYLRDFTTRTGVRSELIGETLGQVTLGAEAEAQLVRIVQEALVNVARHADASRVWVRIEVEAGSVGLLVEDNGVGFDPARAVEKGHFGLLTMQERAEAVGGRLTIDSRPGSGCRVRVMIPLTRPAEPDMEEGAS